MILIPIGTDAPLYHRPFATIGLIAANVAVFAFTIAGENEGWLLRYGEGLHPMEWIASAFFHFGDSPRRQHGLSVDVRPAD